MKIVWENLIPHNCKSYHYATLGGNLADKLLVALWLCTVSENYEKWLAALEGRSEDD